MEPAKNQTATYTNNFILIGYRVKVDLVIVDGRQDVLGVPP